jgi:hypothetical protein
LNPPVAPRTAKRHIAVTRIVKDKSHPIVKKGWARAVRNPSLQPENEDTGQVFSA